MPADREPTTQAIAQALADVSEKAQLLVREEIELAKAEVTGKVKSIGVGVGVAAAAGLFVVVALLFLLIGFAFLVWYSLPFPDDSYFWGFFIVAGILLVLAGLSGYLAFRFLSRGAPPVPTMAIEEAQKVRQTIESPDPKSTV